MFEEPVDPGALHRPWCHCMAGDAPWAESSGQLTDQSRQGGVGYFDTHCAKTNNADCLARQLESDKLFLARLNRPVELVTGFAQCLYVFACITNISCRD